MTVKEFIKNKDNFIITRDGEVLGIKNDAGSKIYESVLNEEIKSTNVIKGVINDVIAIRL